MTPGRIMVGIGLAYLMVGTIDMHVAELPKRVDVPKKAEQYLLHPLHCSNTVKSCADFNGCKSYCLDR